MVAASRRENLFRKIMNSNIFIQTSALDNNNDNNTNNYKTFKINMVYFAHTAAVFSPSHSITSQFPLNKGSNKKQRLPCSVLILYYQKFSYTSAPVYYQFICSSSLLTINYFNINHSTIYYSFLIWYSRKQHKMHKIRTNL